MGKANKLVVVEGEGSCFIHGHYFGELCPKCEEGKQQGLAAKAAGKVRKLRPRALQEKDDPHLANAQATLATATPAEVKKYANGRMPAQKPGKSEQVVGTPRDLLDAVEARFGKITFDLAATKTNRVCKAFYSPEDDSLRKKWRKLKGNLWLNPPFKTIDPWAAKCAFSVEPREFDTLCFLVPASVGANWFREHVWGRAYTIFLNGRVTFEGHSQAYPKDLLLGIYGYAPGVEVWDWRNDTRYPFLTVGVPEWVA